MTNKIETPTIKEILIDEFIKPANMSFDKLVKETGIPFSTMESILYGNTKINKDISLRLAKYFNVSNYYFLNIQNDIDNRKQLNKQH